MSSGEGENEGSRRRGGGIAGEMIKIRMTVSLDINAFVVFICDFGGWRQ